ncbi:hypothetical protein A2872_02645 [Candidatus Gottesmanbacteria bacterium RIFCSPHIGHO2_01_FULL_42_12]|uniref:Uncharacterized protein n=1 Tax=Candidatus Gottesmanbacteria bacterium RIFCSPHIGHO2_01_FULL_42_12 TaxID=1798377 RepID=A0A1F5Z0I4_9BACT|nr:MAG: hypothetical protein A2872_02645 [Candidatus Gottesmanbacteria bacterium RIFCSPHIGHO2_01_FULL_42_12]
MPRIKVEEINRPPSSPAPQVGVANVAGSKLKFSLKPEILKKIGDRLSSFVVMPQEVKFQGEDEDETVILLLRRHVVTNIPWIIAAVLLFLAPSVVFPLLFAANVLPALPLGLSFVGALFWYMASTTYVLLNFLYWYFNVYIVTDERVVDVDWYSLLFRRVATAQISKIQDVSNTIGGVIRSVFDFGNVHIETAGELENIEFEDIPHPALVAEQIQDLMQAEEKEWEVNP